MCGPLQQPGLQLLGLLGLGSNFNKLLLPSTLLPFRGEATPATFATDSTAAVAFLPLPLLPPPLLFMFQQHPALPIMNIKRSKEIQLEKVLWVGGLCFSTSIGGQYRRSSLSQPRPVYSEVFAPITAHFLSYM